MWKSKASAMRIKDQLEPPSELEFDLIAIKGRQGSDEMSRNGEQRTANSERRAAIRPGAEGKIVSVRLA